MAAYGTDAFPHLPTGRSIPPCHFQPIDWTKVKEVIKLLINNYDRFLKDWKQSGFHDKDIPSGVVEMTSEAKIPFSSFADSSVIRYMHEFVYEHPNILDKVSGKVFSFSGHYIYMIFNLITCMHLFISQETCQKIYLASLMVNRQRKE